jgi:hypothetical protein
MMSYKMNNNLSLFANLFAAVWCSVALVLNIMSGNVFFIIVMSALIPLNLFTAYEAFKRMIKEEAAMKQLVGENQNDGN